LLIDRLGKVDYIINLASISDVDVSISDPTGVLIDNQSVAVNVLEFARHKGIDAFLHISTDEVYGPTDGKTAHAEWSPIVPSNPYSASKAAQEAAAICYWRSYGLPLIIVNVMNMFGEMQSPAKFPAICQRLIRAGEVVKIHKFGMGYGSRFYIHSRNAADAMVFLLETVKPRKHKAWSVDKPDRFNIVGDKQVSNLDMAWLIANFIGKPLHWEAVDCGDTRPGHDVHYGLSGEKLAALGWVAPHSFEYSLQQTVLWYERNPQWLSLK
jgi:dTDP-glucose 4,6-dehydratase